MYGPGSVMPGYARSSATLHGKGRGKNKVSAALLAFALGGIGVHKFYLGGWFWGLLYLCFCWTFIPVIIATVEGIVFLTMSEEAFNEKYNFVEVSAFTW
jgi:TM2 domain-containing membrane protein YozV